MAEVFLEGFIRDERFFPGDMDSDLGPAHNR